MALVSAVPVGPVFVAMMVWQTVEGNEGSDTPAAASTESPAPQAPEPASEVPLLVPELLVLPELVVVPELLVVPELVVLDAPLVVPELAEPLEPVLADPLLAALPPELVPLAPELVPFPEVVPEEVSAPPSPSGEARSPGCGRSRSSRPRKIRC